MENTNNILTGLSVASQVPLNKKEYVMDEATLLDLGPNNNLAYTYYKGLRVSCQQERTQYEWKEMEVGDVGLLPSNFTYPNGLIVDGIDYSNKAYNFVKIEIPAPELQDLQSVIDVNGFAGLGDSSFSFTGDGFSSSYDEVEGLTALTSRFEQVGGRIVVDGYIDNDGDGYGGGLVVEDGETNLNHTKTTDGIGVTTYVRFNDPISTTNLFFPAKSSAGNYTLATLDDIIPPTPQGLQEVLDEGGEATLTNGTITAIYEMLLDSLYAEIAEGTKYGFMSVNENIAAMGSGVNSNKSSHIRMESADLEIKKQNDFQSFVQININNPLENAATYLNFPAKAPANTIASYTIATLEDIPTITGAETKIVNGTNTVVTGSGTVLSPYQIAVPTPDGTETKLTAGTTTAVTGNGATGTPYIVETINLQKAITADYLLSAVDNNYSIKINNGATPITITVPLGLPSNFFAGFTQKGTGDVTFVGPGGVTINNPVGLKIKGTGYHVGLEQIGATNEFDLLGFTKA